MTFNFMDTREALAKRLICDHPNDEQLAMINKWKPNGMADYSKNEFISVPILASTNMLREDLTVWTPSTLESMRKTYDGESFTLDHAWEEVGRTIGFVYAAEVLSLPYLSNAATEFLLETSIDTNIDQQILATSGFMGVICYCAVPSDSLAAGAIRNRQLSDVSTGGITRNGKYICPLCGGDFGKDDEHYMPNWFNLLMAEWGEIDYEDIAPFAYYQSKHFSKELSFVTAGNVPQATIFTEQLTKLVYL